MQTNIAHLSLQDTADTLAAMNEHPEPVTRQRIGGMEYVRGNTGTQRVALCIDAVTGESIRVS